MGLFSKLLDRIDKQHKFPHYKLGTRIGNNTYVKFVGTKDLSKGQAVAYVKENHCGTV